jgi:hypothetical protein
MFQHRTNLFKAGSVRQGSSGGFVVKILIKMLFLVIGFLFLLGVAGLPFFWSGHSLLTHVQSGRADLLAAENYASQMMIGDALHRLELAEKEFTAAQRDLGRLRLLTFIPYVAERVQAAEGLLDGGVLAVSAVRDALQAVSEVLTLAAEGEELVGSVFKTVSVSDISFRELSTERKRSMLAALYRAAPRLSLAVSRIDEALVALGEIPVEVLDADLIKAVDAAKIKLRSVQSTLSTLTIIAEHLPKFLGHPEQQNYLMFFENNTELRPTGGFLGVYGLLQVKDAEIVSIKTDDIYSLDGPSESTPRPAPPEPIARYINIDKWYLRDANWSPNFPTSAEIMEQFYYEEARVVGLEQQPINGIIVITPQIAADLLRLVEPITIGDKTFTADNLVDELEFAVEVSFREEGIPFFARKNIVGELVNEMLRRLTAQPLSNLISVVQILEKNLSESHVLLWMKDPSLQKFIQQMDWGGRLRDVDVDYLTVIDANLASFKSDSVIERNLQYTLTPVEDGLEAALTITYAHHGKFDWKTTRYRTYTRVYVPEGSELIGVDGAMMNDKLKDPARRLGKVDVYSEFGRTVFGAFISIEPGEKRALTFRYRLAPSVAKAIAAGKYQLDFEKQPGTTAHGLTLELNFGKNLTMARPAEDPREFGDSIYKYSTDLRLDREFIVGLR